MIKSAYACAIAGFVGGVFVYLLLIAPAFGHTGSPALPAFSSGDVLTANGLNNALAHLHNTLSGGITNAHVSSLAAISHSKLASPELIPKAWATVPTCDGSVNDPCVVNDFGGVTAVYGDGSGNGKYRVNLSYSPPGANFAVVLVSTTDAHHCVPSDKVAGSGDPAKNNANFIITCTTGAGVGANSSFDFIVMDG